MRAARRSRALEWAENWPTYYQLGRAVHRIRDAQMLRDDVLRRLPAGVVYDCYTALRESLLAASKKQAKIPGNYALKDAIFLWLWDALESSTCLAIERRWDVPHSTWNEMYKHILGGVRSIADLVLTLAAGYFPQQVHHPAVLSTALQAFTASF